MKKTLKRITPLQLGKVAGAVYGLLSLIFVPFFLLFGILSAVFSHDASAPSLVFVLVGTLVAAVVVPVIYAALGFIFGALGAWGYNLISRWVGGIEVDVE